jgi:nucleotide-binding universal stress UspA family protein
MSSTVMVLYEASESGRLALAHGEFLARERGTRLTVVVCVPREREDVGCARCRHGAVIWNHELREIAGEELAEARRLLDDPAAADYRVAYGTEARDIAEIAARERAQAIVVPFRRGWPLAARRSRALAERLRAAGRWEVRIAPASGDQDPRRVHVAPAGYVHDHD